LSQSEQQLFAAASLGGEEFCHTWTVRGVLVVSECGEQLPLPELLMLDIALS